MIVKKNVRKIQIVNFGPIYLMYLVVTLAIVTFNMILIRL